MAANTPSITQHFMKSTDTNSILATLSVAISAVLSYFFGGWFALFGILLAFVAIDIVTGWASGYIRGELSSEIGRKGVAKKVLTLGLVAVGHLVDATVATNAICIHGETIQYTGAFVRDGTCLFLIGIELISVMENFYKSGVKLPGILVKGLYVIQIAVGDDIKGIKKKRI